MPSGGSDTLRRRSGKRPSKTSVRLKRTWNCSKKGMEAVNVLFAAWLRPREDAEKRIASFAGQFDVAHAAEFRAACEYVQRKMQKIEMQNAIEDAFQDGVFDESAWFEASQVRSVEVAPISTGAGVSPGIVEFTREYLARVQQFECGSEIWSEFAADWIKGASPAPSRLAVHERPWNQSVAVLRGMGRPGIPRRVLVAWPDEMAVPSTRRPATLCRFRSHAGSGNGIPGEVFRRVQTPLLSLHHGSYHRHGAQESYPDLCLFVHPENSKAIHFYQSYGFAFIGKTGPTKAQMYMCLE